MAEISGYVKGPYEGVSQAPPQVRLMGACDDMQDCIPSIPNGVQKRPPLEWQSPLNTLGGSQIVLDQQALFVDIPRGDLLQDLTLLLNREAGHVVPYLFNTASWSPVAISVDTAAQTYLDANAPQPNRDLRVCSVEDTSFITNRLVPTAVTGATAPTRPFEALIWCKLSGYARKTVVTVISTAIAGPGTYVASFITGTGSNSNDPLSVGTDKLAAALVNGTNPAPGNCTPNPNPLTTLTSRGFTINISGSLIYITHPTVDFQLAVSDDVGGTGVIAIKGSVQRFSDLPAVAASGFVIRVAQEGAGGNSDYYVQFVTSASTITGTWKEVLAPGADVGLDPATMPIGLVLGVGGWHLKALPWKQRLTGNKTLSPDPEFVGSSINALGWWRGRLGLVSNGQVNLSASDDPFKFYTTTLITSLDSDPIGLLTPVDIKTFFKEAVIFDQRFLVMGNKGQAVISAAGGKGPPTPGTTLIEPLSKSEYTDQVPTQGANHKIYFAAPRGLFLSVFELSIDRLSGLALPEDMTPAVPRYLPSTIDRAGTFESDYVSLYGSSGASQVFVHMFRHAEQQRVQNAWHRWNLPVGFTLAGLYVKNAIAYIALRDPLGNAHAATMDLSQLKVDPGGTLLTHADLRVSEAQLAAPSYNSGAHTTSFTLPYPVGSMCGASCRAPAVFGGFPEGYAPAVVSASGTTVVLQGDWRSVPLFFGYRYASFFIPNRFYKVGQDGSPERSGRLNINHVRIDLNRASYLRAEVTVKGRATRLNVYNGFNLDETTSGVDAPPDQEDIVMSFPVGGKSEDSRIRLVNDTFLGFALTGYEWEGIWNPKAQRVT